MARYPGVAYLQAAQCSPRNTNGQVTRIVIHDMEIAEGASTAESCARMFHTSTIQASAHFCVDADSVVQCVELDARAWHAPPNTGSVGIEHAGFASQSRAQWLDTYGVALLTRSAALTAWLCRTLNVPIVKLSPAGLLDGRHGLCGHVDVTNAWHQTDHTDPGAHFPWDWYLAKVKELSAGPVPPPVPERKPQVWSQPVTVKDPVTGRSVTLSTHVDYWVPIAVGQEYFQAVVAVQYWLNRNGCALQLDGVFGRDTLECVRYYQEKRGLVVDGVVGATTAVRLGITTP